VAIVNYTHVSNLHSLEGAKHGMGAVISDCGLSKPTSLLPGLHQRAYWRPNSRVGGRPHIDTQICVEFSCLLLSKLVSFNCV
jgi:hypothetical protein